MYDLEGPEQAEFIEVVVEVRKEGKEALRWNLDELVVGESLSCIQARQSRDTLGTTILNISFQPRSISQTHSQRSDNPGSLPPLPPPPPSPSPLVPSHPTTTTTPTSIAKRPN